MIEQTNFVRSYVFLLLDHMINDRPYKYPAWYSFVSRSKVRYQGHERRSKKRGLIYRTHSGLCAVTLSEYRFLLKIEFPCNDTHRHPLLSFLVRSEGKHSKLTLVICFKFPFQAISNVIKSSNLFEKLFLED